MRMFLARSARRCVRELRAIYPRYFRAAAAGVPVRARGRCSPRGASAMRRERRHIAVPTPSGPRVPSHPQPARGRADPQRGEETARTSTPAGVRPRPRACPTARGNPTRATEVALGQVCLACAGPSLGSIGVRLEGRERRRSLQLPFIWLDRSGAYSGALTYRNGGVPVVCSRCNLKARSAQISRGRRYTTKMRSLTQNFR